MTGKRIRILAAIVLVAVLLGMLTGWAIYKADIPQDPTPVVHSQNIAEITQLAAQKDRLDYLLVAKPLSDAPRYIFKLKGTPMRIELRSAANPFEGKRKPLTEKQDAQRRRRKIISKRRYG